VKDFLGFWVLVNTYARLKLKSEAIKTYLSYLWWLLEPALFVAGFYIVFAIILDFRTANFVVFLVCGKIPYLWFSRSLSGGAGSIFAGRELLTNASIRPELFPMVDFFQNMYKQIVAFMAMLLFLITQGFWPDWSWLLLPFVALTQLAFMMPLVLAAAWITSMVPDVRMLINILVLMMMFLSGVFWDINALDPAIRDTVMLYNPLAFLIDAYRQILLHQSQPDWLHLALVFIVSVVVTALMFLFYRRTRFIVAKKVLYS
jgi:lipopolysaccharide transport system permease protein